MTASAPFPHCSKYNFKRSFDGRVWVKSNKGEWYAVRLDMEVSTRAGNSQPSGSRWDCNRMAATNWLVTWHTVVPLEVHNHKHSKQQTYQSFCPHT